MTTNPNPSGAKPRKPRQKKWASEVARQAHSNQRRKLAREAAEREQQRLNDARRDLRQAAQRLENEESNKRLNMVGNGLAPRLNAVMNSWGLRLPVTMAASHNVSAYTDFKRIVVNYDRRLTSYNEWGQKKGEQQPITTDGLRQIAAETRGLFYHELGHNLFTVPVQDLLTLAWLDGFTSKHPQFPTFGNITATPEYVRDNQDNPQITWPLWILNQTFHQAWNVLEDQRMEMALIEESPQIASYLTVLVLRQIVGLGRRHPGSWALVAGRTYLPASTRQASKTLWEKDFLLGQVPAEALGDVIARYIAAETPAEMVAAILDYIDLTKDTTGLNSFDDHREQNPGRSPKAPKDGERDKISKTGQQASKAAEDDAEEGEGQGGTAGDEDAPEAESFGDEESKDDSNQRLGEGAGSAPDEGEAEGDFDPDEWESTAEHGDASTGDYHREHGTPTPADTFEDDLNETLDDLADDATLQEDVSAMNDAYDLDDGALPSYNEAGPLQNQALVNQAHAIVDDLVQAFNIATADCAPHWESQQRRGVLEPIRYRTRQPGDLEIFRQYLEDGDPGADIDVSIFLDVSASMRRSVNQLGAAAWAAKTACDQIGVACDVTLFDTGAWRLWGPEERAEADVPTVNAHGCTDPTAAFDAVLHDERYKTHHLVLVMTDGAWDSDSEHSLRRHHHQNSKVMLFDYDAHGKGTMHPNPGMANKLGADEAYTIYDLFDIPRALESMLLGLV